jgi:hypothetical protein
MARIAIVYSSIDGQTQKFAGAWSRSLPVAATRRRWFPSPTLLLPIYSPSTAS